MKVTIIIPAYNEAKTLPKMLNLVLAQKIPYGKEVIVVDDGSRDGTSKIKGRYKSVKNLKWITNGRNLGKGAAIGNALKISTGGIILIQDADLEYSPSDYPRLLAPFGDRTVKVVYGSRILGANPISHWTFNLGGRLLTKITNVLYGTKITDEATGYKVFKKSVLDTITLKSKKFEFCPELTAKIAKAKIKIVEVPVKYRPRPIAEKKIKWYDGVAAIFYLVKYRLVN
ncbi:glycosyltransferase family 2 protein [Candidatus Curtissbacteria bacterium]|nr:glycosyltransferase family 2 protein [Candidatus Curtissbacteria bacterium]